MEKSPTFIVSCDVALGQNFDSIGLDTVRLSRFMDRVIKDDRSDSVVTVEIKSPTKKDLKCPILNTPILGRYYPESDKIQVILHDDVSTEDLNNADNEVAERTLLHEIGHFVDSKKNPFRFFPEQNRRVAEILKQNKETKSMYTGAVRAYAVSVGLGVASITIDGPKQVEDGLIVGALGFMIIAGTGLTKTIKNTKKHVELNQESYHNSRNEVVANMFEYQTYPLMSGKLFNITRKAK